MSTLPSAQTGDANGGLEKERLRQSLESLRSGRKEVRTHAVLIGHVKLVEDFFVEREGLLVDCSEELISRKFSETWMREK